MDDQSGSRSGGTTYNGIPHQVFSLAIFYFLFSPSFFYEFLNNGFLARLLFEDSEEGIDVIPGDGLKNDLLPLFNEMDARAELDAVSAANA